MATIFSSLLIEKRTSAETTRFVYDGNNRLMETDDVGMTEVEFTYEPLPYANVLSQRRDGDSSFYHFDPIGNVRELTDDTEVVTDERRYDAWGKVISDTGSTPNSQWYKGRSLAYRHEPDAGVELYALHHREYDPVTGAFFSADPAEEDWNLYRYVKNNPVNREDPSGLEEGFWSWILGWWRAEVRQPEGNPPLGSAPERPQFARAIARNLPEQMQPAAIAQTKEWAGRSAGLVEAAGEFFGVSAIYRITTQTHVDGRVVTNGEIVMDFAPAVGSVAIGTVITVGGKLFRITKTTRRGESLVHTIEEVQEMQVAPVKRPPAPVSGVPQVLESSASSWKKHGARLYADLKNVFELDVPFAAKSAESAKLVAAEYQKLIQSGVLKYKGFVDEIHGSFHVYGYGGNLYLFGKDGSLISRLAPGSEGRATQRILGLLSGGNP